MDCATGSGEISRVGPTPDPTPSQVVNDLRAWARMLGTGRHRHAEVADVFRRSATAIEELSATGKTRRNVWRLCDELSRYARWRNPWAASAGRAAGVLQSLWLGRNQRVIS